MRNCPGRRTQGKAPVPLGPPCRFSKALSRLLWLPLLLAAALPASALQQSLELRAGWNLISFAVPPANPAVDAVLAPLINDGSFQALWTYDAASKNWSVFAQPATSAGAPSITTIQTGRGYWLRVARATHFSVLGVDTVPVGTTVLSAGWNLQGFTAADPVAFDSLFTSPPVREIWTYDAAAARFQGIVFPPGGVGAFIRQDFTQLQPGQGYWVLSDQALTLDPALGTALPSDVDNPPLLPNAPPDVRKPWTDLTPGDEDIGNDGFYDVPATQRALTFHDNLDAQSISILNTGKGILNWSATIDEPDTHSWLRFRRLDESGRDITFDSLSGAVATETDRIDLIVDRTGLAAGDYSATVTIASNGVNADAVRTIDVFMRVAELDGDYQVRADIDTINGKPADTASPQLYLSLYRDRDGLKAIIDDQRTLLFPQRVRLSGGVYQNDTNMFIVSGAFELPARNPDNPDNPNPYGVPLRREITLIGDRRHSVQESGLGPLDLKGEYRETIRNVLSDPIYLVGTFIANRVDSVPTVTDKVEVLSTQGANIPDNGALEREFTVTQRVLVTQVDFRLNVTHTRPSDLVITLTSPSGQMVRLRDRSSGPVGTLTYDEDTVPVDNLELFNGELSDGVWTLRIADQVAGETGSFVDGALLIQGTQVHSISGTISNVGAGADVLVSGCGLSRTTTTTLGGSYEFDDLIDCIYRVTVHRSGFETTSVDVPLGNADTTAPPMAPASVPFMCDDIHVPCNAVAQLPKSKGCRTNCFEFTSLTTAGGAGVIFTSAGRLNQLQYGPDAATFDLDRLPTNPKPSLPGLEDSDYFTEQENPTTMSNGCASPEHAQVPSSHCLQPGDLKIDPPAGASSQHLSMAMGLPVIGISTSVEGQLSMGASP